MACRAFIVAVIDTTILIDTVDQIDCSIFKILKGTILTQIKDIIFGGLTNNPKRQQERVVFSVISILRSTFPCYSSQSK